MLAPVLAITAMDRLVGGLIALTLGMVAYIIWLFIMIALGFVWRRMTRRRRERSIRFVLLGFLALTTALFVGLPRHHFHAELLQAPGLFLFTENRTFGLTSWLERSSDAQWLSGQTTRPAAPSQVTTRISAVGIVAIFPALAVLFLLARWLWRNVPGLYRRPDGRCDWCDYDLRGHHSVNCPECGEEVA